MAQTLIATIGLTASAVFAQQPAPVPQPGLGILEAVQWTLQLNPSFHFQERQVDVTRASLLSTQSLFDTTLTASLQQGHTHTPLTQSQVLTALAAGVDATDQIADATTSSLTAQKLLRNGDTIGATASLTRNKDNLLDLTGVNTSQVAIQFAMPLLRNRGRDVVAAPEEAARLEVDATTYDVSQLASQLINGTATAYWQYVGAIRTLEVEKGSEVRGRQLLDDVQELIRGGQLPEIEAKTALANAASRAANRAAADLAVVQAGQSLGVAIGLTPDLLLSPSQPTDTLPDGLGLQPLPADPDSLRDVIHRSFERRADYLAAQKRVRELELQLVAATNQLKPQLNLAFSAGYAGVQESNNVNKYLSALFQNVSGPNVTGSVNYQFPFENSQARGRVLETQATLQQARLRVLDVSRTIGSSVIVAVHGLNNSLEQLRTAKVAADSFRDALEGERDKLRLGVGSIVDILQVEDRYVAADLQLIQAQIGYASAIVNLRLATGAFLDPDKPVQVVQRELFFTAR
jgi:outer membrane protein